MGAAKVGGERLSGVLLPLASLALFLAQVAIYRNHTPYDDAFITFRYARNLAEGLGPVFNAGERVEGYSNFLWMLILAAAGRIGFDIPRTAIVLGVACGAATLWVVSASGRSLDSPSTPVRVGGLAALMLASMHPFAFYSVMGLETPLFTLLLTASVVSYEASDGRLDRRTAWLLLGACLTRPEGILFAGVLWAHATWMQRRRGELGLAAQTPTLLFAAAYAAHLSWRFYYYGDWLPNTYYAKRAAIGEDLRLGLEYVWGHIVGNGGWLAIAAVAILWWRGHRTALLGVCVPLLVAGAAFVISAGGDHFPRWRFLVPLLPLSAFLIACAVRDVVGTGRRRAWLQLAIVAACGAVYLVPGLSGAPRFKWDYERLEEKWKLIGRRLGEALPPGTTIATSPVGAIGFYSGLPVVDVLGMTDDHIARTPADPLLWVKGHQKHDAAYVLSRRPDLLILNNGDVVAQEEGEAEPKKWLPMFRVAPDGQLHPGVQEPLPRALSLSYERDIVEHPDLRRHYRNVGIHLTGPYFLSTWQLEGGGAG